MFAMQTAASEVYFIDIGVFHLSFLWQKSLLDSVFLLILVLYWKSRWITVYPSNYCRNGYSAIVDKIFGTKQKESSKIGSEQIVWRNFGLLLQKLYFWKEGWVLGSIYLHSIFLSSIFPNISQFPEILSLKPFSRSAIRESTSTQCFYARYQVIILYLRLEIWKAFANFLWQSAH